MYICVGNLTLIGPDNGLSPGRRQAIIWINAGILLIGPWETNFSEILIGIQTFSLKKMHFKMSSAKWHPFCLGLNVLRVIRCHCYTSCLKRHSMEVQTGIMHSCMIHWCKGRMELQIIHPLVFVQFSNQSAMVRVWISNYIDDFGGMYLLIHALI